MIEVDSEAAKGFVVSEVSRLRADYPIESACFLAEPLKVGALESHVRVEKYADVSACRFPTYVPRPANPVWLLVAYAVIDLQTITATIG